MAVKPIPGEYRSVTPYLIVADGAAAVAFYQQAFGAREDVSPEEVERRTRAMQAPGG
jgi:uncharacterized glyoxalase superfamily protein PhnB